MHSGKENQQKRNVKNKNKNKNKRIEEFSYEAAAKYLWFSVYQPAVSPPG